MKRILAILKDKLADQKLNIKIQKMENALNAAELNAQTELMEARESMDAAVAELSNDDASATDVITKLKQAFERQREIKEGLNDINDIRSFLNEEVKVEKD